MPSVEHVAFPFAIKPPLCSLDGWCFLRTHFNIYTLHSTLALPVYYEPSEQEEEGAVVLRHCSACPGTSRAPRELALPLSLLTMLTPPRAAFYYPIAVPLTVSPTLLLFVRILVCVFPLKAPQICAAVDVTIHVLDETKKGTHISFDTCSSALHSNHLHIFSRASLHP